VAEIPLKIKFPRLFELAVNKECRVEEMWSMGWGDGGEAWVWRRRLLAWEEESLRECTILLSNIVLQDDVIDSWRWLLDLTSGNTVKGAYRLFTTIGEPLDRSLVVDVWYKQIPSKVSMFAWRLFWNRLPTKDNLLYRRVISPENVACVSGCGHPKTANHLFLDCMLFSSLWYQVW